MTFARMNNKSRDIRGACGASTLADLSDNKFLKDYYRIAKPYLGDDLDDEISKIPSVEELLYLAEEEFINYYNAEPTCAAFAPASLNLAGKVINRAESKSLSMAVQFVTLIVGKSYRSSNWCHVKTLSDQINEEKEFRFYMNADNLDLSAEEAFWIRCLKATIQSFKARTAQVPGFKIVIISSVPLKRGLGSSSALVVALYTFLEAITNTYTGNILEKTLACHLVEKLATTSVNLRIADTLASVVGQESKIFSFNARSLNIDTCNWDTIEVELILITNANAQDKGTTDSKLELKRLLNKEILNIFNTTSRSRVHPATASTTRSLFSREARNIAKSIKEEGDRISKMMNCIRSEQWEVLGKLLWENYHFTRKYLSRLPDETKRIINVLETTDGVLGASIISHDYNPSIIVMVQRSRLKTFVNTLNCMKMSLCRYYAIKPSTGATILYKYELHVLPWNVKNLKKSTAKYHYDRYKYDSENHDRMEDVRSLSLFIPQ